MTADQPMETRLSLAEQRLDWAERYIQRIDGYLQTLTKIEQDREHDKEALKRAFEEIKGLHSTDNELWTTVNEIHRKVGSLQTSEEAAWRQHDESRHARDFGGVNKGTETGEPEDGPRRFKHWLLYGGGIIVILGGFATAFQMGVKIGGG